MWTVIVNKLVNDKLGSPTLFTEHKVILNVDTISYVEDNDTFRSVELTNGHTIYVTDTFKEFEDLLFNDEEDSE